MLRGLQELVAALLVDRRQRFLGAIAESGKPHLSSLQRSEENAQRLARANEGDRRRQHACLEPVERVLQRVDHARVADGLECPGDGVLEMLPLLRQRLCLLAGGRRRAVELVETGGQRREELLCRHLAGFDQLDQLCRRDAETGSHRIERAGQALAELPAQLLHRHHAFRRHLRQRQQRALRIVGGLSGNGHRSRHRLEHRPRRLTFGARPLGRCGQICVRLAGGNQRQPETIGHVARVGHFFRGLFARPGHRRERALHALQGDINRQELPRQLDAAVRKTQLAEGRYQAVRTLCRSGDRARRAVELFAKTLDLRLSGCEGAVHLGAGRATIAGQLEQRLIDAEDVRLDLLRRADAERIEGLVQALGARLHALFCCADLVDRLTHGVDVGLSGHVGAHFDLQFEIVSHAPFSRARERLRRA